MSTPEDQARQTIDDLLNQAGWFIHDPKHVHLCTGRGATLKAKSCESD